MFLKIKKKIKKSDEAHVLPAVYMKKNGHATILPYCSVLFFYFLFCLICSETNSH